MTMNAVLVFIPMPGMGHFLSMVNVAKLLMDLNSNLSSAVLFNNLKSNPTVSAEFDSIIATTASARIKFINLPPPPFDKDVPLFKSLANFGRSQKPSIVEAVTNIVRSVPGSPQLAG
ncbi:hypothetical protein COLO4_19972 [Corchorus olitorius]|uniref:UDP-glucuronosyl/UDP-glucosyltransferase n=1 Tax=Corchorus olitorius TaxID=93759 RepID=A0A1R3J2L3_9ROSI|nr:hypothetical protein COLO4_19972 [Corchorus olitorius]